jgi:hypothetical protein
MVDFCSEVLMRLMQLSILIPMVVVWRRKNQFPKPVQDLSWYVYWSAFSVVGALAYPRFIPTNYPFITGFNAGKILLFAIVYFQVLHSQRQRKWVVGLAAAALVGIVGVAAYDLHLSTSVSRVTQCAMLAGFSLLYLNQFTYERSGLRVRKDSIALLSLGQLLYSAGTVTAFSFEHLSRTTAEQSPKYIFVAISGLVFNYFLTRAFLAANKTPLVDDTIRLAARARFSQA